MDLITLLNKLNADGVFGTLARNSFAQFGTPVRRYVGAEILPERLTSENAYREDLIRYRTVIANDAPRYSPPVKKGGADFLGSFLVETGTQDILAELTGREFDALVAAANRGDAESVAQTITNWVDLRVNRALIEKTEVQRWQALVDAQVVRVGANGYTETISYSDPAGHRSAEGGSWANDAYDPMDDIIAKHELLASKGYRTSRIITSTAVVSALAKNAKISARTGTLQVVGGSLVSAGGFATINSINQMLQSNGLPVIETYDATYRTEDGTMNKFLAEDAMVFVAEGGLDPQTFQFEDETRVVSNPLGYTAIGRGAGQQEPGRVINVEVKTNKPPRVEAEGWQESLPVITEVEAVAVINDITTA
jgi:hypothetical protein